MWEVQNEVINSVKQVHNSVKWVINSVKQVHKSVKQVLNSVKTSVKQVLNQSNGRANYLIPNKPVLEP